MQKKIIIGAIGILIFFLVITIIAFGFRSPTTQQSPSVPVTPIFPAKPDDPHNSQQRGASNSIESMSNHTSSGARIGFYGQADLYKFAVDAVHSNDSGLTYEAYTAAKECFGELSMGENIGVFAGGGTGSRISGNLTPERQLAIMALNKKCAGFQRAGQKSSFELIQTLKAQGKGLAGPEFTMESNGSGMTEKLSDLQAIISSTSVSALENALPSITMYWVAAKGLMPDDPDSKLMGLGAMLALCSLGKDCSESSYATQLACVMSGNCSSNLYVGWEQGLSDQDKLKVSSYKELFVASIKNKDFSSLGISTSN